jgi:hypothetical protein
MQTASLVFAAVVGAIIAALFTLFTNLLVALYTHGLGHPVKGQQHRRWVGEIAAACLFILGLITLSSFTAYVAYSGEYGWVKGLYLVAVIIPVLGPTAVKVWYDNHRSLMQSNAGEHPYLDNKAEVKPPRHVRQRQKQNR